MHINLSLLCCIDKDLLHYQIKNRSFHHSVNVKQNLFFCSLKLIEYSAFALTVVSSNPAVGPLPLSIITIINSKYY